MHLGQQPFYHNMVVILEFDETARGFGIVEKGEFAQLIIAQRGAAGEVVVVVVGAELILLEQLVNAFASVAAKVFVVKTMGRCGAEIPAVKTNVLCRRSLGHVILVREYLVGVRLRFF